MGPVQKSARNLVLCMCTCSVVRMRIEKYYGVGNQRRLVDGGRQLCKLRFSFRIRSRFRWCFRLCCRLRIGCYVGVGSGSGLQPVVLLVSTPVIVEFFYSVGCSSVRVNPHVGVTGVITSGFCFVHRNLESDHDAHNQFSVFVMMHCVGISELRH